MKLETKAHRLTPQAIRILRLLVYRGIVATGSLRQLLGNDLVEPIHELMEAEMIRIDFDGRAPGDAHWSASKLGALFMQNLDALTPSGGTMTLADKVFLNACGISPD